MESRHDQGKRGRYDPSMSRRTRKTAAVVAAKTSSDQDSEQGKEGEGTRRPSLKDLLQEGTGEEGVHCVANAAEEKKAESDQEAGGREEEKLHLPTNGGGNLKFIQDEKHLQMVMKGRGGGVKPSGMVARCVKVLNHMVKARSGSKKKRTTVQFLK